LVTAKIEMAMMLTFPDRLQLEDVVASQKVESARSRKGGAETQRAGQEIDHHLP
jgi:hypothetical protein